MSKIDYGINPPKDYIPVPAGILEQSIVQHFEHIVDTFPDRPAVKDDEQTLTYKSLNESVNNLAHAILERIGRGDGAITFLLGQDINAIIAFLAILKAGRPYLALQLENPVDRMRMILSDAESPLLVSRNKYRSIIDDIFPAGSNARALYIEDVEQNSHCENPSIYVEPDFPFCLIYTSGSTGKPKGIVISHVKIASEILSQTDPLYFSPSDRISLFTSLSVGASHPSIHGALMSGGLLCLYDLKKNGPQKALDWIRSEQLTIYRSSPTVFRSIFNLTSSDLIFSNLRIVAMGGEPVPAEVVALFKAHTPRHCLLVNELASSEAGNIAIFPVNHQTQLSDEFLPGGYPVPYKEILLLDEEGKPVKQGEEGEIVIRSRYLSSGYWKQPELTASKFHTDPSDPALKTYYSGDLGRWRADGALEFLGRRDANVKIRGFSVQLEAIDYLLQKMVGIQEATCAAYQPSRGGKRIVAYLVPAGSHKPSVTDLREALSAQLPDYMVPSVFVWLEALPRTVTGKINRKDLPAPSGARPDLRSEFIAPRNAQEELIARIWCDLLQLESVGVEDNFFELGGDSLLALSMTLEVEKKTAQTVDQAFFQHPTIAHMMETLGGDQLQTSSTPHPPAGYSRKRPSNKKGWFNFHTLTKNGFWLNRFILPVFYRRYLLSKPYVEANHWLAEWCRRPLVAHGLYQAKYKLFCRMIASLDGCTVDPVSAFPASIMGNILRMGNIFQIGRVPRNNFRDFPDDHLVFPYWNSLQNIINYSPLSELDKYFSVSGLEYLERAYRDLHGVILLTYHSTGGYSAIMALPRRLNCDPIQTISRAIAKRRSPDWQNFRRGDIPLAASSGLNAGEALRGQHLLAQGKIIQIVGDSHPEQNIRSHRIIVAGRQYFLPTGFAELALNTGAIIVPHFTTTLADGHVHTTFLPPLVMEPGNREIQIEGLMTQYADFLTSSWKVAPESMNWRNMQQHFKYPVAFVAEPVPTG